jgi:hypothetical protein
MDIIDIDNQPLSSLLLDFNMCGKCKTVDRNMNREFVGFKCPDCGTPSEGGINFFSLSVRTLVDLIQDYYHLTKDTSNQLASNNTSSTKLPLAVIIFFSTLGEVLLEDFLVECMKKQRISRQVQKRLLEDNLFSKQRIEKLFPLFTGISWKNAVKKLSKKSALNYAETVRFYLDVVKQRNKILHEGYVWNMPPDMPKECMQNLWSLISLFVDLHNEFIRSV